MPAVGLRVLLVGGESAALRVFRLIESSENVTVAVVTGVAEAGNPESSLSAAARKAGVPLLPASLVKDAAFAEWISLHSVDLLINVNSLAIICPEAIAAPRLGSFNLHPGPLPYYAGLNCVSWAIFNGELEYGVTLHWMDDGIDTGPIAFLARFPIEPAETALTLSLQCVRQGLPLVARLLSDAGSRSIPREMQDQDARRYYGANVPQGGKIDWSQPGQRITAFVRACDYGPFRSPWGHPGATLAGAEVEVLGVTQTGRPSSEPPGTVGPHGDTVVEVASGDEWIAIERVRLGGEAVAAAAAFASVTAANGSHAGSELGVRGGEPASFPGDPPEPSR